VRSALYAPAHRPEQVAAAIAAQPDAVIVDLEDGIRDAEAKAPARSFVHGHVDAVHGSGAHAVVRVNGFDTEWYSQDVSTAIASGADAVMLPMAEERGLADLAGRLAVAAAQVDVWALIERGRDALAVDHLLVSGIVSVCTIGYGDLCKELGLALGTEHPELVGVRALVVDAARRHDVLALDGVVIGPPEAAEPACASSSSMGFAGRTLYDRRHVPGCHRAFRRHE
jgi:citrate lyase beta subunit